MKKRRVLAMILSMCMTVASIGCMTACGGGGGGGKTESGAGGGNKYVYNVPGENKLTIKIKNFGGGPGNVWLEETAERFAQLKQNEKYGDKTGVYITYESSYNQNTSSMSGDSTSIFFDERASDPSILSQNGLLLNLDSIVKDTTREGGSLESKIFESSKDGIMKDGSYYALPHYEFYTGLSYNRTTFENLNAYFAAEDEDNIYAYSSKYGRANFVGDKTAKKSVGPDGKSPSADDGLPRSLDEFIILCDFIKNTGDGIAPITVSGLYYKYVEYIVIGFWSALAGTEQMRNYYNCTGEIEVVERDTSGNLQFTDENLFQGISYIKKPKTKWVTMKEDGSEGWMGNDMAAKYYAIAMYEVMVKEGFFSATAKSGKDHWTTQMDLFMDGQMDTNNSAMLVEGSYWYNEANENGGLSYYETFLAKNRSELDVQWMSLPTSALASEATGKDACFLDCGQAYAMINGNVESNPALKQACLDFLAFCYSEAELKAFTAKTGLARAINYEIDATQKASMSKFTRGIWEARDNVAGSNVVSLSGTTATFKKARNAIKLALDAGVLTDGHNKFWMVVEDKGAKQVFSDCSLFGSWSY
ncbi:MAG: hypothetical protein IKA99_07015 [Clostridia bacterium]|nr:hypothetical protein [Clostridia bacterium]